MDTQGSTMTDHNFKNINGVLFTKDLFYETARTRDNSMYTLKDEDHTVDGRTYISLYRRYMDIADITEYTFAIECLHSWEHWKLLAGSTWFQPYAAKWREELEVSQRSAALANIMKASKGQTRDAFIASKYIAEGWDKPKTGKGRPTKEQVLSAAKDQAQDLQRIERDHLRLVGQDG